MFVFPYELPWDMLIVIGLVGVRCLEAKGCCENLIEMQVLACRGDYSDLQWEGSSSPKMFFKAFL